MIVDELNDQVGYNYSKLSSEIVFGKGCDSQRQNKAPVKEIQIYDLKEVAEYLHMSLPTLHDYTKVGWLKSYKIGTRLLYKNDEIEESLRGRKFKRGP